MATSTVESLVSIPVVVFGIDLLFLTSFDELVVVAFSHRSADYLPYSWDKDIHLSKTRTIHISKRIQYLSFR